ncbi:hypothetical protein [Streptomyces sp. NPDC002553]|uniref:hypothetical protein n=1 Tax=Streptomyces sp. NPDC002553 TaxID=3154417 RepID=UPI003326CFC9
MVPVSGPFPITDEITNTTSNRFYKTTADERGLTMLSHFVYFSGDDLFADTNGWHRFNTTGAVPAAAALIHDVFAYVHQHAGGTAAVRQVMSELIELADTDADPGAGGISDGLTDSVSEKRLTEIERNQAVQGHLLQQLAAHLGVQTRP